MGLGSVNIAEKKAKQNGAPVYLYNFGYKSEIKIPGTDYAMGTPHAMDITFKFNNEIPPKDGEAPRMSFGGNRPERFVASHNFAELWTTSHELVNQRQKVHLNGRHIILKLDPRCALIRNAK